MLGQGLETLSKNWNAHEFDMGDDIILLRFELCFTWNFHFYFQDLQNWYEDIKSSMFERELPP